MAKTYTYTANQLEPGDQFMVRGRTTWSRIFQPISGAALERDNARRIQKGISPMNRPYTTVNICSAGVVYTDPASKTKAEIYAEEHLFQSTSDKRPGMNYDAVNQGTRLPWVATMDEHGELHEIVLEGELDINLDVTLVCRVFKSKTGRNNGVSLDGVILHEPVRYFSGGSGDLSKLGLTLHRLPAGTSNRAGTAAPDDTDGDAGADPYSSGYQPADTPFGAAAPTAVPGAGQQGGIRS